MQFTQEYCRPALLVLSLISAATASYGQTRQRPRLVVQSGHETSVLCVVFSPDGKTLASSDGFGKIKLWDVRSGNLINNIKGYASFSLAFSPDGRILATSRLDNTVALWSVETGKLINTLQGHTACVSAVAFSPDGKTIASGGSDATIRLWEAHTTKLIATLEGHTDTVTSIALSSDGKTLVSGSYDKTIKIWDIHTLRVIRTLYGHTDRINSVAISRDGTTLASSSQDATVRIWDPHTGKLNATHEGTEETVVAFSPDGGTLAAGVRIDKINLWDVRSSKLTRSIACPHEYAGMQSIAFSPNGKTIAGGTDKVRIWDVHSSDLLITLRGLGRRVNSVAASADGKTLVSGSSDNTVRLWSSVSGELKMSCRDTGSVDCVAATLDGTTVASGSYDGVTFWNSVTGGLISSIRWSIPPRVNSVAFSPDGKLLAIGTRARNVVELWSRETNSSVCTLAGHTKEVGSVVFSPDGKTLASGSRDGTVKLWNVGAGGGSLRHTLDAANVDCLAFTPDGSVLAGGGASDDNKNTIKLWNVESGKLISTSQSDGGGVCSIAYSPDGQTLACGSFDSTIRLWDVRAGTEVKELQGHESRVSSVAFTGDGKTLVSGSEDTSVRLWNVVTGKEQASLYGFGDRDWTVVTPDSRFDGTPEGLKQLHWVQDNKPYTLSSFFEGFFTPHLLAHVTAADNLPPPRFDIAQGVKPTPLVSITYPKPGEAVNEETVAIKIQATDTGGGAEDIRLYHNGKLIGDDAKRITEAPANGVITRTLTVSLVNGGNAFRAVAFNSDRVESYPAELNIQCTRAQPTAELYVIAVGVGQYQNGRFNLDYPTDDARAFVTALSAHSQNLFKQAHTAVLLDKDATKDKIESAFDTVIKHARPQDVFVFYYSGHGAMSTPQAGLPSDFHLVCSDVLHLEGEDGVIRRGVSAHQLKDWCTQVKAQKQLLLLDACQAGGAAPVFAMKGFAEEEALAQLAHSTGVAVLAASLTEQSAGEYAELKHGMFTYVLLAGLNGEAGKPDGKITPGKLKTYIEGQVPILVKKYGGEAQYPTGRIDGQDFPIGVIGKP